MPPHASLERTIITTKLLLSKFGSIRDLLARPPAPACNPHTKKPRVSLQWK